MTEQAAAFPESEVRAGKEPIAAPDIASLPRLSVWDIKNHPRNVRKHNLKSIAAALETFGQQTPIVVQMSTGYVCKGNGTLKAARDVLGWGWIYASVVELTDEMAMAYLLADNRASDLADYDRPALSKLLKELEAGTAGLQGSLWTLDDAETIWAEMGDITITDPEAFKGGYVEDAQALKDRIDKHSTGEGVKLREVVLALKPDAYEQFALDIAKLSRAYGTTGVIATVLQAVHTAAEQVVS